jgi:hypothetical protein
MPHVDPTTRFWIGVIVTVAIGVSSGSLVLTNAVSPAWIPSVTAWCGIISFVGSALLTALNGMGATTQSRLASAAADPSVKAIVASAPEATAAPSNKVVSSIQAAQAVTTTPTQLAVGPGTA